MRLRQFFRDRGSLMTTMAYIILATGIVIALVSWFLLRQSEDYKEGLQAQVRSSISQLSTNLLGELNGDFPTEWQTDKAKMVADTKVIGDTPALHAEAHLVHFDRPNEDTGVIVAEAIAVSTTDEKIVARAKLRFVPTGAAVYGGTDDAGRPVWLYSSDDLGSLALYELAPNGVEFINKDGGNATEAPEKAPSISLSKTDDGAKLSIGAVLCAYDGTQQYQYRWREGTGSWSSWSKWSNNDKYDFTLDEGQRVEVEARTRCSSAFGVTDASPVSDSASYVRPLTSTPVESLKTTVTKTGKVSWAKASCPALFVDQYRYARQTNGGSWSSWSSWGTSRSFTMPAKQGTKIAGRVEARCSNPYVTGPVSARGNNSVVVPITTKPAAPTMSRSGSENYTAQYSNTCPAGTTFKWSYRTKKNAGAWTGWSSWRTSSTIQVLGGQGSRVSVQGRSVCYNNTAKYGPVSANGKVLTHEQSVTSRPTGVTPSFAGNHKSFSWSATTCPVGTKAYYRSHWRVNSGGTHTSGYSTSRGSVSFSMNQGDKVTASVDAYCKGYLPSHGPTTTGLQRSHVKPLTYKPSTPTVTVRSNTSSVWSKSSCPAGSTWKSRHRMAKNNGAWSSWSSWGGASSLGVAVPKGQNFKLGVQARCKNATTGATGPIASDTTGWKVRALSAPTKPKVTARADSSTTWTTSTCPAGSTWESHSRVKKDNGSWSGWSGWSTGHSRGKVVSYGHKFNVQVQTRCHNKTTGAISPKSATASSGTKTLSIGKPTKLHIKADVNNVWWGATCPAGTTAQYKTRGSSTVDGKIHYENHSWRTDTIMSRPKWNIWAGYFRWELQARCHTAFANSGSTGWATHYDWTS